MGAMTTLRELTAFWQEMTAEERIDYRVRFGDDVYELISITPKGDDVEIRGYQLNGPMAQTQRDDNSRAARVRMFPLNLSWIEILDRDEPVERDDDPGPPPTRLTPEGEYERVDTDEIKWQGDLEPFFDERRFNNPVSELPRRGPFPTDNQGVTPQWQQDAWAGNSDAAPKPPSALDTPVDDWASTAIRMPHALLDRLSKTAKQRMIGRNILLAHIVEQGLNDLDDRPVV